MHGGHVLFLSVCGEVASAVQRARELRLLAAAR
jgi:hypothetical protein